MASLWSRIKSQLGEKRGTPTEEMGRDRYPLPDTDLSLQHEILSLFLEENANLPGYHSIRLKESETGRQISASSAEEIVLLLRALTSRLIFNDERAAEIAAASKKRRRGDDKEWQAAWRSRQTLKELAELLLRRKLPLTGPELEPLAEWIAAQKDCGLWSYPVRGVAKAGEYLAKSGELTDGLRKSFTAIGKRLGEQHGQDSRKAAERFEALLGGSTPTLRIQPGEAWSDQLLSDLEALSPEARAPWIELLQHCSGVTGGKPTQKWVKTANQYLGDIGQETFRERVLAWFARIDQPRTDGGEREGQRRSLHPQAIIDPHVDVLKGLVWCCREDAAPETARALSAVAISAYKKIPGVGPRMVKLGNACVAVLGSLPGLDSVGQLALLKVRVKFKTAQNGIEKALISAAERLEIPRDELEEMAVPVYGLTEVGRAEEAFGDFRAVLEVTSTTTTALHWIKPDGKTQKSIPAGVKEQFPEELRELRQAAKDIQKMLPAQRERIDQFFLQTKSWNLETWRERYLDHPLVGALARRLIWRFSSGGQDETACFDDGELKNFRGDALEWISSESTVELWHPLDSDPDVVLGWRNWLEERGIQQPFKQAHREVYLLTDAERTTRTYSNRFAAHILKQHQFNALCAARGWRNTLRLMVDDAYPPASIELPNWGLRAEFWIEGIGEEYGLDTNETGTYLWVATDQVRFYPLGASQRYAHAGGGGYETAGEDAPLPLEQVPRIVLSEILRDVDMFVGVASVGNDPNWSDGGPDGRHQGYWESYSFGELSETAQTRKAALERLVPRLKIADRCEFIDRFLVVRGDLRTYKIHLKSGNIQMEPNDQYLCIVAGQSTRSKKDTVFLPFEGDAMLSIILSKAFLLAEDSKIQDPTIVSQIRG